VQGVIKSYDPGTGDGTVLCDTDLLDYELAAGALDGSVFRMVRQGQRVIFDLDGDRRATGLRLGSEVDMGTPGFHTDTGSSLDAGMPVGAPTNDREKPAP